MATRIKLTEMERRILDKVFLSRERFAPVEDLLASIGADRNQFVDALESLEGEGYLSVSNLGGSVVVTSEDPVAALTSGSRTEPPLAYSNRVGVC